jgi:hypothetical protein
MTIHIKKENVGKFTAYKKRTGKTTIEALHSKDSHVRQMANFARNVKKWNHKDGGLIKINLADGGTIKDAQGNVIFEGGKSYAYDINKSAVDSGLLPAGIGLIGEAANMISDYIEDPLLDAASETTRDANGLVQLQDSGEFTTANWTANILDPTRLLESKNWTTGDQVNKDLMTQYTAQKKIVDDKRIKDYNMANQSKAANRSFYANKGGLIKVNLAAGGELDPLASDTVQVDANNPGTDTVALQGANVDNGEVIQKQPDGTAKVFSDDRGYADVAKKLAEAKGNLERQAASIVKEIEGYVKQASISTDNHLKGTLTRRIEIATQQLNPIKAQLSQIDQAMNQLFANQEQSNPNQGQSQGLSKGGPLKYKTWDTEIIDDPYTINNKLNTIDNSKYDLITGELLPADIDAGVNRNAASFRRELDKPLVYEGAGTSTESPNLEDKSKLLSADNLSKYSMYLDNIGNAALTASLSNKKTPITNKLEYKPLETNVDITAQLQNIASNTEGMKKFINNNTVDSNNAVANMIGTQVAGMGESNRLYSAKNASEQALRNQNVERLIEINRYNNALKDTDAKNAWDKDMQVRSELSANLANVEGNIAAKQSSDNLKEYQGKYLGYLQKLDQTGVSTKLYDLGDYDEFINKVGYDALADKPYAQKNMLDRAKKIGKVDANGNWIK